MAGPGLFTDIGKKAKDLLTRDYNYDQKLSISTYSVAGVMSYSRRSRYDSRSPSPFHGGRSVSRSLSRSRSHSSDVENPGNNLYVTGLSSRITKYELEKHFAREGEVTDVHLVVDPWTRESRGFAFVTMANVKEANRCLKYLDGSVLEGRVITVEKCSFHGLASDHKVQCSFSERISSLMQFRYFSSKVDWSKLRPVVLEKIKHRDRNYTLACDVLKSRAFVTEGVSTLLKVFPVKTCKICGDVYIGDIGHQIKPCHGSKRISKDQIHRWSDGNLSHILAPSEPYHRQQNVSQHFNKPDQTSDPDRLPAIVQLCHQAAPKISAQFLDHNTKITETGETVSLFRNEVRALAQRMVEVWEALRSGVEKLLIVCPAKVCKICSEVHFGSSDYKPGLHEVLAWRCKGSHRWKKAGVDDFIPLKLVWHRRPHDPMVLVDSGRNFYGRAPAVVSLCVQAGARVPVKYSGMMKMLGLSRS